ncbi:MAG: hypothetical protein ACRCX2_38910 [Paraclostridium sp.]
MSFIHHVLSPVERCNLSIIDTYGYDIYLAGVETIARGQVIVSLSTKFNKALKLPKGIDQLSNLGSFTNVAIRIDGNNIGTGNLIFRKVQRDSRF